ncbi:MAG: hypothetical protein R3308_11285, partial [Thiohalobacterales bacterium]|nr:hypothetical protein [Thiohalobacterales bacterium]
MGILKHFWNRIFSRGGKSAEPGSEAVAVADQLEGEISAVSDKLEGEISTVTDKLEGEISAVTHESQALAEEVERVRSEAEHAREEEQRKLVELEQIHQNMETALDADHRKLAELESLNSQLQAARQADSKLIAELGERIEALEKSREEIEGTQRKVGERIVALELDRSETADKLEKADQQIASLQTSSTEQARQFRASLSDASSRLDDADTNISRLEIRTRREREDYLKTFDSIMGRYRKQETRLNWTVLAAVFALLLGAGAGAVLVWDMQKNAKTLAGMSDDIKALMSAMEAQQKRVQVPSAVVQAKPAVPVAPPPAKRPGTAPVAKRPAPERTVQKAPVEPKTFQIDGGRTMDLSFLSNPRYNERLSKRQGTRQYQRKDASDFFEENARVEGVVSLASGAQYRIVKHGSGKSPTASDTVVLNYVGIKPDGTVID